MDLHVEQAEFENGKQPARARANDQHVGFDDFAHIAIFSVERGAEKERHHTGCVQRDNPLPSLDICAVRAFHFEGSFP